MLDVLTKKSLCSTLINSASLQNATYSPISGNSAEEGKGAGRAVALRLPLLLLGLIF